MTSASNIAQNRRQRRRRSSSRRQSAAPRQASCDRSHSLDRSAEDEPRVRQDGLQAESLESVIRMKHGFYDRTKTRVVYHVCPSSKDSSDSEDLEQTIRRETRKKPTAKRKENQENRKHERKRGNQRLVTFNSVNNRTVYPKHYGSSDLSEIGNGKRKYTFLEKMMGPNEREGREVTPKLREAIQKLIREHRRIKMLMGLLESAERQGEIDPVVAANMRRKLRQKQLDILEQMKQGQLFASLGIDATLVERPDKTKPESTVASPGPATSAKDMTTYRSDQSLESSPLLFRAADMRRRDLTKASMPDLRNQGRNSLLILTSTRKPRPQSWGTTTATNEALVCPPKTEPPRRKFLFGKGLLRRQSTSEFAASLQSRYRGVTSSYTRLHEDTFLLGSPHNDRKAENRCRET